MLDENIFIFADIFQFFSKTRNSKEKICYSMQQILLCNKRGDHYY